jgi:hypothetical protein
MEKTMGKPDDRDSVAPDPQDQNIESLLRPGAEEYLTSLSVQPQSTLLRRVTNAVLEQMFHIPTTASASFDDGDFVTKLASAGRVEIQCRTFYLYYPRSQDRLFRDVRKDVEVEVYAQIIKAYEQGAPPPPAPRPSLLGQMFRNFAANVPWLRRFGGAPADAPPESPVPPPPTGLQNLINRELRKEAKRHAGNNVPVSEDELARLWKGLPDQRVWLRNNVIGCWLRPYPKEDPTLQVHVVGRPNLYYRPVLEDIEAEKGKPIYLAARLRLVSEGGLNVHDFNRSTPEYIHIIDTQEQWEFTTGSLEHHDLIVNGKREPRPYKIANVTWRNGWQLLPDPADSGEVVLEPLGYRCRYLDYIMSVPEVGYVPNLRLRGRVLPRYYRGEKDELLKDAALVRALEGLGVTEERLRSAIVVEPGECWLVSTYAPGTGGEEAWLCSLSGQNWRCDRLEHRQEISSTSNRSYVWRVNNNSAQLPDCFAGELEYKTGKPEPIEITATKGQAQTFGRQEPFGMHDAFLSNSVQLVLRSQGRDNRARALYHVEHNPDTFTPDLFIVHDKNHGEPLSVAYERPGVAPRGVNYNGRKMTAFDMDDKNVVQHNGTPLLLYGEGILLICGTSTLILSTSSSIPIGGAVEPERAAEAPAAAVPEPPGEASGWASIEKVLVTLRSSPRWDDVRRVDRLTSGEQGTYTQGFEFTGRDNAKHFVKCYRADLSVDPNNRELARQEVEVYRLCADLPVVPPLEDVLPGDDIPQLLVMPKLQPLEMVGLSLPEILALGYATAILLERLEERRLVHYDLRTTKFTTDHGRIKLIDYNSVFPVLDKGEPLQPLHRLLVKWGLPEAGFSSPERREFLSATEGERPRILRGIGPASSIYALARVLLSIRGGLLEPDELAQQWEQELGSGHGQRVGALLKEMTEDDPALRPTARRVKEEMRSVLSDLRRDLFENEDVRRAETLLGPTLDG